MRVDFSVGHRKHVRRDIRGFGHYSQRSSGEVPDTAQSWSLAVPEIPRGIPRALDGGFFTRKT